METNYEVTTINGTRVYKEITYEEAQERRRNTSFVSVMRAGTYIPKRHQNDKPLVQNPGDRFFLELNPKPKRPRQLRKLFTFETVPADAWWRYKNETRYNFKFSRVEVDGFFTEYNGTTFTFKELADTMEYSINGRKTWLPAYES